MELEEFTHVDCDCLDFNHSVRFHLWKLDDDRDEKILSIHYRLNNERSFFFRLKNSIKYLFKLDEFDDSCWHSTDIDLKSAEKIAVLCHRLRISNLKKRE